MALDPLARAKSKLKVKDVKLKALLDVTNAINENTSKEELFSIYREVLQNELNIGKLALFIFDKTWKFSLHYNVDIDQLESADESSIFEYQEIAELSSKENDVFEQFDILVPVHHKAKPLAYVLIGDMFDEKKVISPIIRHLPFIQTLTNIIAVAIENKNMANEIIAKERLKKELEFASQMQNMLLPEKLPQNEQLDVAAFYQAHQEVGGDYYDFVQINSEEVLFCMSDVSGKGMSAALLMSNFQANLRALAKGDTSLPELVTILNQKVLDSAKGEKFITFFVAKYNIKERILRYVNAGHNPPLMYCDNTITLLKTGCPGLGMLDYIPSIKEGIVNLSKDAIITCYTDGLIELENDSFEEYGTKRLSKVLENSPEKMTNLNTFIMDDLNEFRQSNPYFDDIALLSVRFL